MTLPLRAAVVGVGHMGRHHARIYGEHKDFDLVAVIDKDLDRARSITDKHGGTAFANINEVFYAFKHYTARMRKKNYDSCDVFMELLTKISLEPFFCEDQLENFLKNHKLTPEGHLLAEAERRKDLVDGDVGGEGFFVR